MCFGGDSGGGSTTTTVVQPADKSPEEQALTKLQLDILNKQWTDMNQPMSEQDKQIQDLGKQYVLNALQGKPPELSPEQKSLLDTTYGAAQTSGQQEIDRYARELAGSRGLALSDSPVAREALLQTGNLQTQLQGSKAAAQLNMPQQQQIFGESVRQFQEQLKQNAIANRMAIAAQAGNTGLGMAGYRANTAPRTSTTTGSLGMGGVFQGMGAAGGLMQGLGSMGLFS